MAEKKAFEQANLARKPYYSSKSKKHITKAPRKPTYEIMYFQCHCGQQDFFSSTGKVSKKDCPAKCMDESTRKQYEVDNNVNCLCPNSRCKCLAAYMVSSPSHCIDSCCCSLLFQTHEGFLFV